MTGSGRVRRATEADRPVVAALQSVLPEPRPDLLSLGLRAGDVLVSTAPAVGDAPVGYLLPVPGESGVHLAELAVAPAYRRQGRASELVEALCGSLDAGDRVTLTVEPSNRAARACYESLGFEEVGRREDYFESGSAVVYVRRVGDGGDE